MNDTNKGKKVHALVFSPNERALDVKAGEYGKMEEPTNDGLVISRAEPNPVYVPEPGEDPRNYNLPQNARVLKQSEGSRIVEDRNRKGQSVDKVYPEKSNSRTEDR